MGLRLHCGSLSRATQNQRIVRRGVDVLQARLKALDVLDPGTSGHSVLLGVPRVRLSGPNSTDHFFCPLELAADFRSRQPPQYHARQEYVMGFPFERKGTAVGRNNYVVACFAFAIGAGGVEGVVSI